MPNILVTGGAGYIGSHTAIVLLEAGHQVSILDNFVNSDPSVVARIGEICGKSPKLIIGDIRDVPLLARVFAQQKFQCVMHFAGLKAVGESISVPLEYFENNIGGTISLLNAMESARVRRLVFSSSAAVYGDPSRVPIPEDSSRSATNPYARSKLILEDILDDLHHSDCEWRIARLRYFNPVGAHESGLVGEAPRGVPSNLVPLIAQVAIGLRDRLNIYGGDYPTRDGTAIRDYIHVMDLARGHLDALAYLDKHPGLLTVNLGTGSGYTVLEVLKAFETVSGKKIPHRVIGRRAGDVAECWAHSVRAQELLGWKASKTLNDMCHDAWRWQLSSAVAVEA